MPKSSPNQSNGLALVLLSILVVLVAIGSVIFYLRIWRTGQTTARPSTIQTKEINSNANTNTTTNTNTVPVSEVTVSSPAASSEVTSPISLTGSAPGTWYFEASFPVRLEDLNGTVLTQSYAQAVGEWMTEEQVQFTSTVEYTVSEVTQAVLVLQPDDPAGFGVTEEYRHPVVLLP